MNGTEGVIVDHNMVVTQVFRRLGKRLDRPCVSPPSSICGYTTPTFIAHFLSHGETSCAGPGPFATDPEAADRGVAGTAGIALAATLLQNSRSDNDRGPQGTNDRRPRPASASVSIEAGG
jgi:hypothetical protein